MEGVNSRNHPETSPNGVVLNSARGLCKNRGNDTLSHSVRVHPSALSALLVSAVLVDSWLLALLAVASLPNFWCKRPKSAGGCGNAPRGRGQMRAV